MQKYIALILLTAVFSGHVHARPAGVTQGPVTGHVFEAGTDGNKTPMAGAEVFYAGSSSGTYTDGNGFFSIPLHKTSGLLIARFLGYAADSVDMAGYDGRTLEFTLRQDAVSTGDVLIVGEQKGTILSRLSTQKSETITGAGLMKMACCNLSESFENSATVTVGYTDAVSGAKQVQLLGLPGVYVQMLDENVPTMRGLAATYGWSFTPGPWLESIQVSKGASSVITGYESLTGQMNLEFKKPDKSETLFINLFADDASRYEANINSAVPINDKLSTGIFLHGSMESKSHDGNGDGFLDMPKTKFVNVYNRWMWINPDKGVESRTGVRFLYETREGGQHGATAANGLYHTDITNRNINVFNKTGIVVGRKEGQSLGIITSLTMHDQESVFGRKDFEGTQYSFYINTLFTSYIGNPAHGYTAGLSYSYDNYKTTYSDGLDFNKTPETKINRTEAVPGAYAQYTYNPSEKFTLLAGIRADNNCTYGFLVTPRFNVRYNIHENIVLRASAGKGYRSANVIADNIGLLASSRNINLGNIKDLDIERAWNMGGNVSFYIPVWASRTMTLSFDYFHTEFQNQIIVDIERDRNQVFFYDSDGRSYADAFQADLSVTIIRGLDLYTAFRYNNAKITLSDGSVKHRVDKPLTSRYRGLVNVSYATNFRKWVFDVTAQLNGPARLPSMTGYASSHEDSPVFPVYFAQVTKNTRRFDIYAGVENIFDYRQKNPIIDAGDPFGRNFDSSIIWGPLMGRKIYAGIRLRIGKY